MDVGTSKGLESFLAFLRETTERHRMAEADRAEAETDAEILDALQGVKLTQDEIRRGACGGMGLAFFRAYYEKLPEEVARRLTEIDTEAVEHITRATGLNLSGSLLDRFGEKLASDAAFAQVIRAANVYRGRLGYAPLGPDGWPEVET